jgi:hypothetical protein
MSNLEIELNNDIDEFILELQQAKERGSYRNKIHMVQKVSEKAQGWSWFWDEKLNKYLQGA